MKRAREGKAGAVGRNVRWLVVACGWLLLMGMPWSAGAQALRIVSYNIAADVSGQTTADASLPTVLEAIGEQNLNGVLQPLDILALEETTSNATTVAPIVTALNSYYGDGTYAMSPYQGTQYGSATVGNGPNALIYNTKTVQLIGSVGVAGTPSKNGAVYVYRQVVRYQFRAVGAGVATYFYVYVSHMKSNSGGVTDAILADRNAEAQYIRADVATLPAGTSVLYMGDFNLEGSTEDSYKTLTAAGTGAGIDPLNIMADGTPDYTQTWNVAAYKGIMTESSSAIRYRDDIQFMSADVYGGTAAAALRYVPGSFHAFGNNGTTAVGASVDKATNTALNNLVGPITTAQARTALTTASDHLPVVGDYLVATPYNTWQLQNFTAAELNKSSVSGDGADPDGDGIVNLLEYALNLDPKKAATVGLPTVGQTVVDGQRYLTLTYTRVIAATGITYLPQVSGDLATWNGGTGYTVAVGVTTSADGLTQTVVMRDAVPLGAGNSRFMRLQVSRP